MMKKNFRKVLTLLFMCSTILALLVGCSGEKDKVETGAVDKQTKTTDSQPKKAESDTKEVVEIDFPTSWVGVSSNTEWFNDRLAAFNEEYGDRIKVNVEEIAGDQAYVDKMKVLYTSNSLPDVISTGGYNLIDSMKDQMVDLTAYVDDEWKSTMSDVCWEVNSRDGKLYGIPYAKQVIGYFYNKELFQKAGIEEPAKTWDEFFKQCDQLLEAGITPISMDTADSGWLTSLFFGAMIAQTNAGEEFMNSTLPTDYNTEEVINAIAMLQTMFQKYTTSDAVGGKYENGASNFFMGETAMIANGPWMVSDFYDTNMVEEGFADKIAVEKFPGDVMYNSGKIGFNIASKSKEKTEASLEFVKYLTSDESLKKLLEMTGDIPSSVNVTSDQVYPLVNDTIKLGNSAERNINDFQSLWYANVVDEISIQYPLLAQGEITPDEFATALTKAAKKN
jgi:raffinose/stachyose/melibiose transport system substrate-binding protein